MRGNKRDDQAELFSERARSDTAVRMLTFVACLVLSSCADERRYVMHEETLIDESGEQYLGGACIEVADGVRTGTGGSVAAGSFSIDYEGVNDGAKLVVTTGRARVERFFDEAWLRGEKPSEDVTVPIDTVAKLRLHLTGGRECVQPREPVSD